MSRTKEILEETKRRLVERGWCQAAISPSGKMCLTVAMWAQGVAQLEYEEAKVAFYKANGLPTNTCLPRWNDALGRTQDEVFSALDRAIEVCDNVNT